MSDITPPPPAQSSGGLPPAIANIPNSTLEWVKVGGGLLATIGVFLPWVTAPKIEFLGSTIGGGSANGFDWSGFLGFLLMVLGLAVAALAFIRVRGIQVQGLDKLPPMLPFGLAGALALIALWAFIDVMSDVSGTDINSGVGLWFVFLGALAAFAAALVPVIKARKSG